MYVFQFRFSCYYPRAHSNLITLEKEQKRLPSMFTHFYLFLGTTDLSGLLRSQPGVLPTFRILTDEKGEKTALFTSPYTLSNPSDQQQQPASINLPSSAILGHMDDAPLIAYKLEDYNKKFGTTEAKPEQESQVPQQRMISVESLLRGQRLESQAGPTTNTPISSLLSLAKQIPVQLTTSTSASVPIQIQQLLASISRSQLVTSATSTLNPSTVASFQASAFASGSHNQPMILTTAQLSQAGSPLQNSVPTLMSSLAKTTVGSAGSIIRRTASASTSTDDVGGSGHDGGDKPVPVKKIDFHDFALPAAAKKSGHQFSETIDLTDLGEDSEHTVTKQSSQTPLNQTTISFDPQQVRIIEKSVAAALQSMNTSVGTQSVLKSVSGSFPATVVSPAISYASEERKEETLGKVSSMLESSPITERHSTQSSVIDLTQRNISGNRHDQKIGTMSGSGVSVSVVTQKAGTPKNPSSVPTSYTTTPKQTLSTSACTRTRRIKTPKQFDL